MDASAVINRAFFRVCLGWVVVVVIAVPAAADDDHDAARRLQQQGEILGLEVILERMDFGSGSRLLETELEREDGRWVYELEVLDPEGRVTEHEVEAATGEVIKTEAEHE